MGIDIVHEMRSRRGSLVDEIARLDEERQVLQGRLKDIDFAIAVVEREMGTSSSPPAESGKASSAMDADAGGPAGGDMKMLWDEVLDTLPGMLEAHPRGVSAKDMAAKLCADVIDVRSAMDRLVADGKAVYAQRSDIKRAKLLTPIGHVGPAHELTQVQTDILAALSALADAKGVVTTPKAEFCRSVERHQATVDPVIRALQTKGFIRIRALDTKVSNRLCHDLVVLSLAKEE